MTRYPKSGKGSKWTVHELNAISPEWQNDSLNDSEGLVGEVRVNANGQVSIAFRYGFKWDKKKAWHYCGLYPQKSMVAIRAERNNARELVGKGIDPRAKKVSDRIERQEAITATIARDELQRSESLTVQDLYDVWIVDGVKRSDGNKYIIQTFRKYVLPTFGEIEVRNLTEQHLRKLYRKIIQDGKSPTAFELSKDVGQMLRWAEKRKPWRKLMLDGNPADLVDIKLLLPEGFTKLRERTLSVTEIRSLKSIFDDMEQAYANAPSKYEVERPLIKPVQLAVWISISTLCRIGELMMTEWRHIDFESRTWYIPAANTKGRPGKRTDHLIYLSDFALEQFRKLHELTGSSQWAFPARRKDSHVLEKSASQQIGDRQVKFKKRTKKLRDRVESNSLVIGEEKWTPHDLRRTGATLIQSIIGGSEGVYIADLCLHHVVLKGASKHYLFDESWHQKQNAWDKLGRRLQEVLAGTYAA